MNTVDWIPGQVEYCPPRCIITNTVVQRSLTRLTHSLPQLASLHLSKVWVRHTRSLKRQHRRSSTDSVPSPQSPSNEGADVGCSICPGVLSLLGHTCLDTSNVGRSGATSLTRGWVNPLSCLYLSRNIYNFMQSHRYPSNIYVYKIYAKSLSVQAVYRKLCLIFHSLCYNGSSSPERSLACQPLGLSLLRFLCRTL
jgi:hypothetical protein